VNQEPNPDPIENLPFETESTAQSQPQPETTEPAVTPAPARWTPQPPAKKPTVSLSRERTSGVAMYMLGIVSGIFMLGSASYLASNVFGYFLVDKNDSFLYFDLSSIDLYFVVAAIVLGLIHFFAIAMVGRGSGDVEYGFRSRHEMVGALFQTILAITLIGGLITLIHTPLDAAINPSEDAMQAENVKSTVVSTLFVMILAGTLLWRDRKLSKGLATLIPAGVAALLTAGIITASIIVLSLPKEEPKLDDGASATLNYNDFSTDSSFSDPTALDVEGNARTVAKKAEAYNALEGTYPKSETDFSKYDESDLEDIDLYTGSTEMLIAGEMKYQLCTDSKSAQVVYVNASNDTKFVGIGGASSTTNCVE
jgi:hypothetical protein